MLKCLIFLFLPLMLQAQVEPLLQAHAHNDYEHERPLLDALDHGFCSVEADVWLVDGELMVAHDRKDIQEGKTLRSLYLEPLRERIQANGGRVYPDGPDFILLVDFKSKWRKTYPALRELLEEYKDILTSFTSESTTPAAVTVIISGNRSAKSLEKEALRYAGIDGRLSDLKKPINPHLMPMISDKWSNFLAKDKHFPYSDETRERLEQYTKTIHEQGATLRFWAVPHDEQIWQFQLDGGVDHLNADDLGRMEDFLRSF